MVLERKSLLLLANKKPENCMRTVVFFDGNTVYYPAKDILFYQSDLRGNQLTKERMNAMKVLLEEEQMTLVTTFDGLMNRLIRPEKLERFILQLSGRGTDLNGFYKAVSSHGL